MVQFARFSINDLMVVDKIIQRALELGIYDDYLTADMDISATSFHCPLRLNDLLLADDFNFCHDMYGIKRHLNRETGILENLFLPRFAKLKESN